MPHTSRTPHPAQPAHGPLPLTLLTLLLALLLTACSHSPGSHSPARPFHFPADTFAYPNELHWVYQQHPETGEWITQPRRPAPTYAHHCFVVARSARQFLYHAKFAPNQPAVSQAAYASLVRQVIDRSASTPSPPLERVIIPAYANLRQFSRDHEQLLKETAGGAWQSYLQRGNWRMILPFSNRHQAKAADAFRTAIDHGDSPIVHVINFPKLDINHAILLFDYEESPKGYTFWCYDPNAPDSPLPLHYQTAHRTFHFPRTDYYPGGPVDVYEIYTGLCY